MLREINLAGLALTTSELLTCSTIVRSSREVDEHSGHCRWSRWWTWGSANHWLRSRFVCCRNAKKTASN